MAKTVTKSAGSTDKPEALDCLGASFTLTELTARPPNRIESHEELFGVVPSGTAIGKVRAEVRHEQEKG